jgi:hypothetical protein
MERAYPAIADKNLKIRKERFMTTLQTAKPGQIVRGSKIVQESA